MFGYWADPVVHLLLLKSSIAEKCLQDVFQFYHLEFWQLNSLSIPGGEFVSSVTRLGDFLKFLGTKLCAKVAQIFSNNFWLLWKNGTFYIKLM